MKFQLKSSSKTNIANLATDCLIITTSCIPKLKLHKNTTTYINKILKQEELVLDANINKLLLLFNISGIAANRLLLISTGKKNTLSDFQFIEMIKNITNHLIKYNISNATLCIQGCNVKNRSFDWQIYQTITNLQNGLYVFD